MQNVRKVPGKRPSHLVRLQYFSTNKVPGQTQLSLEDSVLRNASRSEIGIQGTMYENERAKAFWDVSVYAESVMMEANKIDARVFIFLFINARVFREREKASRGDRDELPMDGQQSN